MVLWSYPPTLKQLIVTAGMFVTGIGFISYGIHESYANMEEKQARIKARNDEIKARIRKRLEGGEIDERGR